MKKSFLRTGLILLAVACMIGVFAVIVAADGAPEATIKAHSLSLNDNIYILYYVDFKNIPDGAETGVLVWNNPQENYAYGTETAKAVYDRVDVSNGYSIYYFTGVSAKMMTQDIYAKTYIKIGDEITYGELDKYSVLQYCYNKKGSDTTLSGGTITLGELIQDILHYGASAQKYFNYHTDRLATADYYQIKVANGMLPDTTKSGLFQIGEQATLTATIENFDHWENSAGETVGTESTLVVIVAGNETYTAIEKPTIIYSEGLEFVSNGDGTCYVASIGTCTDTDIKIPPVSPDGDTVTAIGKGYVNDRYTGFYFNDTINSVKIPNSVTSIGELAFSNCRSLTSIEIPSGVTSIGQLAFYCCYSMTSITVAENNPIYHSTGNCIVETATKTLIVGCNNSVIPDDDSITIIGESAFYRCIYLTSIAIPNSVTSIGPQAFRECTSLIDLTLGDGIESIEDWAFFACHSLPNVIIPNSVTSIGIGAFAGCIAVESMTVATGNPVYHSAGNCIIETATDTLIAGCKNSEIPLDGSVTSIGDCAFYDCTSLESITIPDSVTSIGDCAFYDCTSLESITIPDSVTSIGREAFSRCSSLETIYFLGTEAEWNAIDKAFYWDYNTGDYVVIFLGEPNYSEGLEFVSNGDSTCYVKGIGTCTDTDIRIPPVSPANDSVTSIGNYAFDGCSSLTSIVIPDSVTSIGWGAFTGCSELTSIEIPNSVTNIDEHAFADCSSLNSIEIPDRVTRIKNYVFYGCSKLTSVEIPNSVTSIGDGAFSGCKLLTSIDIPESVTSIGVAVFASCSALESITSANLSYPAIQNCLIKASTKALIAGCKNSVIPTDGSVASIEDYAFYRCTALTSITIPNSVTSIGREAFSRCSSLETIYFLGTEAEWNAIDKGLNWDYNTGDYVVIFLGEEPEPPVYSEGLEFVSNCDGTCYVAGIGTCTDTDIVIPPVSPAGDKVTAIGDGKSIDTAGFYECKQIKRVVIPDSVISIRNDAFHNSTLQAFVSGKSSQLESIGDCAFYRCTELTSIEIPDSIKSIGESAFRDCTSLQYNIYYDYKYLGNIENPYIALIGRVNGSSIKFPDIHFRTKVIADYAFAQNYSLELVSIPQSVVSIGNYAFRDCDALTGRLFKENSQLESIGNFAFSGCSKLTSITIPDNVTSIGEYAFSSCSFLTSVTFGENSQLTSIDGAFSSCSALTNIEIPDNVTAIGDYAFNNCIALTSVTFGENSQLTSIGEGAFWNCYTLTSIEIPDGVTNIGLSAFSECTNLQYNTYSNAKYLGSKSNPYHALIKAVNTSISSCIIHPDNKVIVGLAFFGCSSLTSIEIPDSVMTIGGGEFCHCASLTSVTVSEGNPFYYSVGNCIIETATGTLIAGCNTSVIPIDSSVTSIGDYAFDGCKSLTSIEIPNSVTNIGRMAFYDCSKLTSITYTGTKAQWKAIEKESGWDLETSFYTIHCTDGDIQKQ